MAEKAPLAYRDMTRPSRDSSTLYRNAARAAAARQPQTSASPELDSREVTEENTGDGYRLLDTWTGYLRAQWAAALKDRSRAPLCRADSVELLSSLQNVIARQNAVVAQVQENVVAQRAKEATEWARDKERTLLATTCAGAGAEEGVLMRTEEEEQDQQKAEADERTEKREASDASASIRTEASSLSEGATTHAAIADTENSLVCVVLSQILHEARQRWASVTSEHWKTAEMRKAASNSGVPSATKPSARISLEAAMEEERTGLPSIQLLFHTLVDGVNNAAVQQTIVAAGLLPPSTGGSDALGLDLFGTATVFQRHIQALSAYPSILPPLEALREGFAALHPRRLVAACPSGAYDSALEYAEAQIDMLVRFGDEAGRMADILRGGLHPSVRRLLYARALRVPLAVTDGKPMFLPQGELMVNHLGHGLAHHLTCATRHSRDKLKRRFLHHYSSLLQERRAQLLQQLTLDDVLTNVGNSDRYFVYADDLEVLATAMVVDRSLPDPKMAQALRELGRPAEQLDNYLTYLQRVDRDLILQTAPPCGFMPVEGFTFLLAPLCNVTGDTVEQYELGTAMMSQLWGRMQGPTVELFQCCIIFEGLVQRLALPAVLHATRNLQYPPLFLAMRWMLTGFAEILEASEVLSLWDVVLSYHVLEMCLRGALSAPTGPAQAATGGYPTPCALWLLPLCAAAIFVSRAPLVEKCRTAAEMDLVFAVGHQLCTRTLLQGVLFS